MNTSKTVAGPRVAVIIPAYGVAHLVSDSITSLKKQDFQAWEAYIIDDGAPDDVAAAVAPHLSDPRIHFLSTNNNGVSAARNHAIRASSAPYIALLDGDDLFRPDYLESMVPVLDANPDVSIVTCNARKFGAVTKDINVVGPQQNRGRTGNLADLLAERFNIYIGSLFRRADFDRVGGFDEGMSHSEDFDLWVRLLMNDSKVFYVDRVLCDYRVRSDSASTDYLKLLRGKLRTYDKVLTAIPDSPAADLIRTIRPSISEQEAVEAAIFRVMQGDSAEGIKQLRSLRQHLNGNSWTLAFMLWRIAPFTAPSMLLWRKRRHARTSSASTASTTTSDSLVQ